MIEETVTLMNTEQKIVPPRPKWRRVMRRRKAWLCGQASVLLAIFTIGLALLQTGAIGNWVCVGGAILTCISALSAVILRAVEQPREVLVPSRDWPGSG